MWAFLLCLSRVSTLIAVAPVFGSREIPAPIKAALSVVLALILVPFELPDAKAIGAPTTLFAFVSGIAGNAVIGLIFGFIATLIIAAVEFAGSFIDVEGGFSMGQTFNPAIGELAAPMAQFHSLYAMLLFLLAHGHYILIYTLAKSFSSLPLSMINYGANSFSKVMTDLTFAACVNGLKIAAPAASILFITDIAFALLSRAAPQMNVFFVGMPVKTVVAFLMVILILPFVASLTGQMVVGLPVDLQRAMEALHR
jgi:flagellar biosynthetic protein FliR